MLSDGLDGAARTSVPILIASQKSLPPYTVHTFGFGRDHDPELMSNISKAKDGSFFFIDKLEQVDEAFVSALGGLLSVQFQDVVL